MDSNSLTPPWVLINYPKVHEIIRKLRNEPCLTRCEYCLNALDGLKGLNRYFGHSKFRTYADEPLQELAIDAAIKGKSLLAIFPTGGGKSITFQLPALMSGENSKELTVVISPLQSLMKDQIDNLEKNGILQAVTLNGLLDPIERGKVIERVLNGTAHILYIAPESLRSTTVERMLMKRKIARFVIDEAHCFSSWGQDFRVDYLYIGPFIKQLVQKKGGITNIPISCFTATAKPKVVEDIREYFKNELNADLELFSSGSSRTNLTYKVFDNQSDEEKYTKLRSLLESKDCPTIIYVSRTKQAVALSEKLTSDGFAAKPFHGKMDRDEKMINQDDFMSGRSNIMVATSAFGMGVDKADVGAVIHYDISNSLENYVQEAGRAGRDENLDADCYVLFNEEDLDKHFFLLNQTKISLPEINQIWKAIKNLAGFRSKTSSSALEIARAAGWDDSIHDIETRVKIAISALEEAKYLKRGQNLGGIYATSILSPNKDAAMLKVNQSGLFDQNTREKASRILGKLFSSKSMRLTTDEQAESRVDYIADQLSIRKEEVIRIVNLLREEQILADAQDLSAFIRKGETNNKLLTFITKFRQVEQCLSEFISEDSQTYHIKDLTQELSQKGIDSSPSTLKTIFHFWGIKNWIKFKYQDQLKNHVLVKSNLSRKEFKETIEKRHELANIIADFLMVKTISIKSTESEQDVLVEFSVLELKDQIENKSGLFKLKATLDEIEDTLFYLSKIGAIKIEGGFLISHNRLRLERLEMSNQVKYKQADYEKLKRYYEQKIEQIHIVGEYAKKMMEDYQKALQFVDDYFKLNYNSFIKKYFHELRRGDLSNPLNPKTFQKLFGELTPSQLKILTDRNSKNIVVAAAPGSGKTKVLVHKLASLLLMEEIKHEQLLMLTFSRAAATEFKTRLINLIGKPAAYVEIKTFHSFCFDLLGKFGTLVEADSVIKATTEKILAREIEANRITKAVLVVDEAQDMNHDEYALIRAIIAQNDDIRVILVGDDDQNIYEFRGSNAKYLTEYITAEQAVVYELIENFRSKKNIVELSNTWANRIQNRLKSTPCQARDQTDGDITITQYAAPRMVMPMVEAIVGTFLTGSTCVLTKTNEDAETITGILINRGVRARLIQTNDGFQLANLMEVRKLTDWITADQNNPVIEPDVWQESLVKLNSVFGKSKNLELARNIARIFDLSNPERKYKSDWKAFIQESKIEDFLHIDSEVVYVSTIHRAKGKEFDNVFLLLGKNEPVKDEDNRLVYVALTRAKSKLFIGYNGNYLAEIPLKPHQHQLDYQKFEQPMEISFNLGLKDVVLDYFGRWQEQMRELYSGAEILVMENGLSDSRGNPILRFSRRFQETVNLYHGRSFRLAKANVENLVYWTNKESGKEILVVMPVVTFCKYP